MAIYHPNKAPRSLISPATGRVDFGRISTARGLLPDEESTSGKPHDDRLSGLVSVDTDGAVTEPMIPVELVWKGISVLIRSKKKPTKILLNISGKVSPGEFLGIVGHSGSGKTVLLTCLSGKIISYDLVACGDKVINGRNTKDYKSYLNFIAYVPPESIFMETLTVKETLEYTAIFKYSAISEKRKQRILELMNEFELDDIKDVRCGDLCNSGRKLTPAERKRLSIAIETISKPPLIFLDDPFMDLDVIEAERIVKILKNLKQKGCTIIATVRRPTNYTYNSFDQVMILALGRMVYNDTPKKTAAYLASLGDPCPKNKSPVDHFLSIIHPKTDEEGKFDEKATINFTMDLFEKFLENTKFRSLDCDLDLPELTKELAKEKFYRAGFCAQFGTLLHRTAVNCIRRFTYDLFSMGTMILFGLLMIGYFYDINNRTLWDFLDRAGSIFTLASIMVLAGFTHYVKKFPEERVAVVNDQESSLYGIPAYFLAKVIGEIPFSLLQPLLLLVMVYWTIPLADTLEAFFLQLGTMFFAYQTGALYALFVGVFVTDHESLFHTIPYLNIVFILFTGFFFDIDNALSQVPMLPMVQYLTSITFAFSIMMRTELERNDNLIYDLVESEDLHEDLLELVNGEMELGTAFLCMGVIYVALIILSLLGLVFTTRRI